MASKCKHSCCTHAAPFGCRIHNCGRAFDDATSPRPKAFNDVEIVVGEKIGLETTTYVRNIYKYYVAYKLMQDAQAAQRQARAQVAPVAK